MITVTPIPTLSDNYSFFIEAENGQSAIVDIGEAEPVIAFLEARGVKPDMVLITHHHWDHMDGVPDFLAWHDCPLIGSDCNKSSEHSPAKTRVREPFERVLSEGDDFEFGGEKVRIFDTPGHTPEHICFYFEDSRVLFSGDVLFAMGCGRVLDGTPEQLYSSLDKLSTLPDDTKVYCGHEYTLGNAEFCAHIAPDNAAVTERLENVRALREAGEITIPSTLGVEKETNIFLHAKSATEFAALRQSKDRF